ncbi:hypothetical protein SAMN05445060_2787 [Williamsia sterculiae]|uniref:Uncharacterized protein n=1 Tax=Williamsia sterculiae TaxID=1344003 RepID=A0A1N7GHE5_9NOCA|nr:hypothetical protein SAMN05445060_2787 [Williamsia sterculiae]
MYNIVNRVTGEILTPRILYRPPRASRRRVGRYQRRRDPTVWHLYMVSVASLCASLVAILSK